MSNYYLRDEKGHWFIGTEKGNKSLAFSDSMEIAYQMGKIKMLGELHEGINKTLVQAKDLLIGEVFIVPLEESREFATHCVI